VKVLVIDVGGTNVKLLATGHDKPRRFKSGSRLTPELLVTETRQAVKRWQYDVISIGYPGKVGPQGPLEEPGNLCHGWVDFHFEAAFGKPVRVVNDAVMQALGGYEGGRMLFLGLGTGLGSALVSEHVVVPLELGNLPFHQRETMAERLGKAGLNRHGLRRWRHSIRAVIGILREAFSAEYVLLGGGNAKKVIDLPEGVHRGGNEDAFTGGFRLWEEYVMPHDARPPLAWRVVT
jgi:predicted NBD/HSP70 family sugar kinase